MEERARYHAPVMVTEVLHYLDAARGGIYIDGTLGGGGHAGALLESSANAKLIGVDQDPDAIRAARERLTAYEDRVTFVQANFADALEVAGIEPGTISGVLLDLGISSHQIDEPGRGFTFRSGATLDMRMPGDSSDGESAADLLNELDAVSYTHLTLPTIYSV